MSTPLPFYLYILIGITSILGLLTLYTAGKTLYFIDKSQKGIGTITALDNKGFPTIQFMANEQHLQVDLQTKDGSDYQVGDTVEIRFYPQTNPQIVKINHWGALWGGVLVLTIFTTIFFLATGGLYLSEQNSPWLDVVVDRFFPYMFLVPGILATILGSYFLYENQQFYRSAERTMGKVIDHDIVVEKIRDDGSTRKENIYYPKIEFQTATGQIITFRGQIGGTTASPAVGKVLEVLYNPDQPQKARINSFWALWFPGLLASIIGIAFVGIGLLLYLKQTR